MSKQFQVYLLPSDIDLLIAELRRRVGVTILQEASGSSKPVELDSPLRNWSSRIRSKDSVSVRCYLAPDDAVLRMSYSPKQANWQIDHTSEVIEFSGCDSGADILVVGRLYFQSDILLKGTIWPKREEFTNWADKVFRTTKRLLHRSKDLDAYVGNGAEEFRKNGGRFVSLFKEDGEAVYAEGPDTI